MMLSALTENEVGISSAQREVTDHLGRIEQCLREVTPLADTDKERQLVSEMNEARLEWDRAFERQRQMQAEKRFDEATKMQTDVFSAVSDRGIDRWHAGDRGDPQAIAPDFPPVVAAQHIPVGFSAAFDARLNDCCSMRVDEAKHGDILRSGHAYIAPGNRHMQVIQPAAGGYAVRLHDGPKIHCQRPAVDELLFSVAKLERGAALGILLTGMGKDGAEGLLAWRNAGCFTIAQDEATCVVFGMPREAIALGAAVEVRPLHAIAAAAIAVMSARASHAA